MCYKPITLKKHGAVVPCNRCPKCIARRVSSWSFRLMQEDRVSTSAHFITLTYATSHVPIMPTGHLNLHKPDLQNFFKRLRKAQCGNDTSPIKYYAVGEYGGHTKRPHYHVILFNAQLELIDPAWNLGSVFYGQVSGASVGYCLKYMSKQKPRKSSGDLRQREFALMSKGLGISYLNETNLKWHTTDYINRMYCNLTDGKKISMPRYYKDKMYLDVERDALRDFYQIQAQSLWEEQHAAATPASVRATQQAIDAAFDKMYRSSFKQKI